MNIVGFLKSQGKSPEKSNGNGLMYCSPFRNEKDASFKVDQVKNVWFDFGTGNGGRLVDLVCQMYNVNVPGALLILSGADISTQSLSFDKQEETNSSIVIKHVQELQNKALLQYLKKRNIPFRIASMYLNEAYYKVNDKQYFALAFKNDKGGYELRNEYFKGGNSPKYFTEIPGTENTINLFEGFMDFLSSLVYFGKDRPANTTIILNSVSNFGMIEHKLIKAAKIYSYMDNDTAGQKTFTRLKEVNPNSINRSEQIHPEYKDFNEFLIPLKAANQSKIINYQDK
jgi:hypothetical protein